MPGERELTFAWDKRSGVLGSAVKTKGAKFGVCATIQAYEFDRKNQFDKNLFDGTC